MSRQDIAKSAQPFTVGEFIKNCMLKVCEAVCPDEKQLFLNVSLSRNTVAERVESTHFSLMEVFVCVPVETCFHLKLQTKQ